MPAMGKIAANCVILACLGPSCPFLEQANKLEAIRGNFGKDVFPDVGAAAPAMKAIGTMGKPKSIETSLWTPTHLNTELEALARESRGEGRGKRTSFDQDAGQLLGALVGGIFLRDKRLELDRFLESLGRAENNTKFNKAPQDLTTVVQRLDLLNEKGQIASFCTREDARLRHQHVPGMSTIAQKHGGPARATFQRRVEAGLSAEFEMFSFSTAPPAQFNLVIRARSTTIYMALRLGWPAMSVLA
ncbi:hypothetical protein B0H14DRAFT_2614075 [Mycena olivaceomarginata]|nr:hypothetical protein B0H14DRAFT_2614075 [Mycena olivaceomarginata]